LRPFSRRSSDKEPEREEGVMKRNWKGAMIWPVLLSTVWAIVGSAQQVTSLPKQGDQLEVEGEVIYIQTKGPAILQLKTADGKEYRVQLPLGMITELRRMGFHPAVGEKMGVAGEVVCVLAGEPVIASKSGLPSIVIPPQEGV
jgi:hypothetical protein